MCAGHGFLPTPHPPKGRVCCPASWAYTWICMQMHADTCICMHMPAYACMCMHMYAYAFICICMNMYAYACIFTQPASHPHHRGGTTTIGGELMVYGR